MFQTIRLGRIFGIDVFWHWTLWPLMIYLAISAMFAGGWTGIATTMQLVFMLFSSVLLHELGHALAAQSVRIQTKDIILLPFGGVARFVSQEIPPKKELWIAFAGPLANLVLAIIAWLVSLVMVDQSLVLSQWPSSSPLATFMQINLILAISNLIPALPLDGGRMYRAVASMKLGYLAGTKNAAKLSRWVGIIIMIAAPFTSWILLILGLFIIVGSIKELFAARFRDILSQSGGQSSGWPTNQNSPNAFEDDFSQSNRANGTPSASDVVDAVEVKKL